MHGRAPGTPARHLSHGGCDFETPSFRHAVHIQSIPRLEGRRNLPLELALAGQAVEVAAQPPWSERTTGSARNHAPTQDGAHLATAPGLVRLSQNATCVEAPSPDPFALRPMLTLSSSILISDGTGLTMLAEGLH